MPRLPEREGTIGHGGHGIGASDVSIDSLAVDSLERMSFLSHVRVRRMEHHVTMEMRVRSTTSVPMGYVSAAKTTPVMVAIPVWLGHAIQV